MLHAITGEDFQCSIVHPDGDLEAKFSQGPAQHLGNALIELYLGCYMIELCLCHLKSVHVFSSWENLEVDFAACGHESRAPGLGTRVMAPDGFPQEAVG